MVRAEPEGLLFVGRADDQIKLGGRRIELGEIDAALAALPGVRGAAAAVQTTPAGTQVLVGYVVPEQRTADGSSFQQDKARALLQERLPAQLVPVLAEVESLPTRTSGKVDRKALPWPLPSAPVDSATGDPAAALDGTAARLAGIWEELLGVRPGPDSDFVSLGGTSLVAARMASQLRIHHPGVSVADLYRHPVLRDMAEHLDSLGGPVDEVRPVRPVPRRTGFVQLLVQTGLYGIAGLRGLVGLALADNVLGLLAPQVWAPHTAWWLIIVGWVVLYSAPMRCALGALAARALAGTIKPGAYPRGGATHLRLWTAERVVAAFGVPPCSAPLGAALRPEPGLHHRAERGAAHHAAGHRPRRTRRRLQRRTRGRHLRLVARRRHPAHRRGPDRRRRPGRPPQHADARRRRRPGRRTRLRRLPGRKIPDGASWSGSPARPAGAAERMAGAAWPAPAWQRSRRWSAAYGLTLLGLPLLALLSTAPALVGAYFLLRDSGTLATAGLRLLLAVPVFTLLTTGCSLLVTAAVVRLLGRGITPGLHPASGGVAWRAWLVTRLLDGARGASSRSTPASAPRTGCGCSAPRSAGTRRSPPCCRCPPCCTSRTARSSPTTPWWRPSNSAAAGCGWGPSGSVAGPSSATPASSTPATTCPTTAWWACSPTPPPTASPARPGWAGPPCRCPGWRPRPTRRAPSHRRAGWSGPAPPSSCAGCCR
ncbi:phosphopantetheine-binding protein [Streptomyces albulus]|nr:phosphopantetheine-binding protein [Streptomyces noursei]